jgi:hypothetical protein
MRAIPDISLNAGTNQEVYFNGGWQGQNGTSLGGPEMAGFFVQANSYLAYLAMNGRICASNPTPTCALTSQPGWAFLSAYAGDAAQVPFYDITSGCNGGTQTNQGFCARPGYDLATGFGTVNMLQLSWAINYWNNEFAGQKNSRPTVVFDGPPTNAFYATDQAIRFTAHSSGVGIAGYTAQWDKDPTNPKSEPNPGTGNPFWDGPAVVGSSTGSLSLAAAGQGCHTAYVRAWDNVGLGSHAETYGPICLGGQPSCTIAYSCPVKADVPPNFEINCSSNVQFIQETQNQNNPNVTLSIGNQYAGVSSPSPYFVEILACRTDLPTNVEPEFSNACQVFFTYKTPSQYCSVPAPVTGPKKPVTR